MRIDFYQLAGTPAEQVIASIAQKLLDSAERLLVVATDKSFLARLDRMLWDHGSTSFLPHGLANEGDDSRQPILLSTEADPANRARNLLIADGSWHESALGFDRTFFLFDSSSLDASRETWRCLAGRDLERRFWAQESGRWVEKATKR